MSPRELLIRALFPPTLAWTAVASRLLGRRWWDRIDERVILGALPLPWQVARLRAELGVEAVVNTCVEYPGPVRSYARAGIEQLRVPMLDFTPPGRADVDRSVDFLSAQVAAGRTVYVHCKAGRGRSATVVLCWLVRERGMSPEEGYRYLVERRPQVHPSLPRRAVVRAVWDDQRQSRN